jgi:2OG-Fe(II) oxygenase superfamily
VFPLGDVTSIIRSFAMLDTEAPFSILDEQAIAAATLRTDPYDYAFVDQAMPLSFKDAVLADAPVIPHRGTYGIPQLKYGPKFDAVIKDLLSPRFRRLVEQKFDIDLTKYTPTVVMMGNTSGNYNEGYAHPDSKHKILTVILGFSREWPFERGRLRVLRSNSRDDAAFEFPPEFGKMLMFRVCDHSYHGFLPQKGQRMSLQFCWVDSKSYARETYFRHRLSAFAKSVPGLRELVGMMPRKFRRGGE